MHFLATLATAVTLWLLEVFDEYVTALLLHSHGFFGVIYGVGDICVSLRIDRWLLSVIAPVLTSFSFHPVAFLSVVLLVVYFLRIFLAKTPGVILLSLILMPWAQDLGIHPGVLLLTMLMATETWFLPYPPMSGKMSHLEIA